MADARLVAMGPLIGSNTSPMGRVLYLARVWLFRHIEISKAGRVCSDFAKGVGFLYPPYTSTL